MGKTLAGPDKNQWWAQNFRHLTKRDWACLETHPSLEDKILEPFDLRPQEKNIILYHHGRWDGKGYPPGLAGEEIPFRCRLLSLADGL